MTPTNPIRLFADRNFSAIAFAACFVVGVAFAALYLQGIGSVSLPGLLTTQVNQLLAENRSAVYGTLASINGSLLGFAIAVTSIVLSLSENNRLQRLRESTQYKILWRTLSRTTKALGIATLVSLACLLFDRDRNAQPVCVAALIPVMVYVIIYLSRTLWILDKIIDLITMPSTVKTSVESPRPVLR